MSNARVRARRRRRRHGKKGAPPPVLAGHLRIGDWDCTWRVVGRIYCIDECAP